MALLHDAQLRVQFVDLLLSTIPGHLKQFPRRQIVVCGFLFSGLKLGNLRAGEGLCKASLNVPTAIGVNGT
jgi:hypothetical protein